MNIKLEYLYRDAANNKEWGDVVFGNTEGLSAEAVASRAESHLIDRLWFVADKVGLPGLFAYPYDPESGNADAFVVSQARANATGSRRGFESVS